MLEKLSQIKHHRVILFLGSVYFFELVLGFFTQNNAYNIEAVYPSHLTYDARFYDETAVSIAEGHGYSYNSKPTCAYQVGYPLFLSVLYFSFGHSYKVVTLLQCALLLSAFIISLYLAWLFFSNSLAIMLVGIGWILNYKIIRFSYLVLSETLSLFLVVAVILMFIKFLHTRKNPWLVSCGLFYGYLTLTRPIFLLFPFILVFLLLFLKRPFRLLTQYLFFILPFLLVVAPYILRNYQLFKMAQLSSTSGYQFFCGTLYEADGNCQLAEPIVQKLLYDKYRINDYNDAIPINKIDEVSKFLMSEGIKNIISNPVKFSGLYFRNRCRLIISYPTPEDMSTFHAFYVCLQSLYFLFCVVSVLKYIKYRKSSPSFYLLLFLFIVYYLCVHSFFAIDHRYGFPLLISLYLISPFSFDNMRTNQFGILCCRRNRQ